MIANAITEGTEIGMFDTFLRFLFSVLICVAAITVSLVWFSKWRRLKVGSLLKGWLVAGVVGVLAFVVYIISRLFSREPASAPNDVSDWFFWFGWLFVWIGVLVVLCLYWCLFWLSRRQRLIFVD